MGRVSLSLLSMLIANVALAAVYNYDSRREDCVDSKGKVGRNMALGTCGDQSGQDLSHRNLTGMNLLASDFSFASLSQAQLDRADISFGRLASTTLDHASLRDIKLVGAQGSNANFDGSILIGADLRQAHLTFGSFVGSDLTTGLLMEADFQDAIFTDAKFKDALARQAQFPRANLTRIRAEKADFSATNFKNARLQSAILRNSSFREADLSQAQLTNADVTGTDFRDAWLLGADFTGTNLRDALIRGAHFDETSKLPFAKAEALAQGMLWAGAQNTDLTLYDGEQVAFSAGLTWDVTQSDVTENTDGGQHLRFTLRNKSMWGAAAYVFRNYEEIDISGYRTLSFRASSPTPVRVMFYLVNTNTGNESQSIKPIVDGNSRVYTIDLQQLAADGYNLKDTQAIIVAVAEPQEKTYLIDVDDIRVSR